VLVEVGQQLLAPREHRLQSALAAVVLAVCAQVVANLLHARGQARDLDLGTAHV
jgi:hypothetical protein